MPFSIVFLANIHDQIFCIITTAFGGFLATASHQTSDHQYHSIRLLQELFYDQEERGACLNGKRVTIPF
jgi:hypothetical protein